MRRLTIITLTAALISAAPAGATAKQDLRSPDARTAVPAQTGPATDLRSPDARGVVNNPVTSYPPGQLASSQPHVVGVPGTSFSWGDAGIGAAGMLALIALCAGTLMIATQRRRDRRFRVETH